MVGYCKKCHAKWGLVQSDVATGTVDRLLDFTGARDGSLGRRAFVSTGGTAYYERKQDCHGVSATQESCFLTGVLLSVVVTRKHHYLNQAAFLVGVRL